MILFLECNTTGGPVPNQPCVFPFIYNGEEFSSCTKVDYRVSWCATKKDEEGKLVGTNWGNCGKRCPGFSGMI